MKQYVLIITTSILFVSCNYRYDKISCIIERMVSEKVTIPFDRMQCWLNDSLQRDCPWEEKAKMKLIVFVDSNSCSACQLNKMHVWKDFVKLESKYNHQFFIYFIFQINRNMTKNLLSLFKETELHHPIYVDYDGAFSQVNPQLPAEDKYHVFLVNRNDSIVLIGNPAFNNKIEERLYEKLEQELNRI